ncbi:hypothetical protein HPP92_018880 [Vanilla planifolia]|uniref:Uncharacterized protein n=1 Tax=Vanilla planifolia TaxID=51239 RepID=A0A835Q5W4_VANPL|nr:hypothetical protein HPP92_018880 [Vanilla planifolia]
MEGLSFSKTVYQHFPCHHSLSSPSSSSSSIFPRSLRVKASSPKTPALLRAGHLTCHSSPKAQELLFSLLKPAVLSLTAAAAVFLTRYSLPSLASVSNPTSIHPAPAAESETLSEDHESSEKILEEHVLSYPNDVKSLQALVQLKVKNQKLGEAIAIVDQLIRLEPDDAELHLLKSHLHCYNGDTEKARKDSRKYCQRILFLSRHIMGWWLWLQMRGTRESLMLSWIGSRE